MLVLTDSLPFAERCGFAETRWAWCAVERHPPAIRSILQKLYSSERQARCEVESVGPWTYLFLVGEASRSQFDAVAELLQDGLEFAGPFVCAAESGRGFHGFKQRPWVGLPGNIHLVACMKPGCPLDHPGVGPTVMSAVAVLETLDSLASLDSRAGVKWVNDILVDGAKVGGVIARTQSMGSVIEYLLLGIGLNVERTPEVPRDAFVPRAAALSGFLACGERIEMGMVFSRLLARLGANYARYLGGDYAGLLDVYRRRSVVLGRRVRVLEDSRSTAAKELRRGRVLEIGQGLELLLDDGQPPVVCGRLVFD